MELSITSHWRTACGLTDEPRHCAVRQHVLKTQSNPSESNRPINHKQRRLACVQVSKSYVHRREARAERLAALNRAVLVRAAAVDLELRLGRELGLGRGDHVWINADVEDARQARPRPQAICQQRRSINHQQLQDRL